MSDTEIKNRKQQIANLQNALDLVKRNMLRMIESRDDTHQFVTAKQSKGAAGEQTLAPHLVSTLISQEHTFQHQFNELLQLSHQLQEAIVGHEKFIEKQLLANQESKQQSLKNEHYEHHEPSKKSQSLLSDLCPIL